MKKPSILFLAIQPQDKSPSQRFRFEQYIKYSSENGFHCEFINIINEKDYSFYYAQGNYYKKFLILLNSIKKLFDILSKASHYDIIFIQREAFMLGTSFFERSIAKKTRLIFNFDDSIWLQNVSESNKYLSFLKNAEKTKEIIQVSDMVFAGNKYLAEYALQFNKNVKIVPTTIDTEEYLPRPSKNDNRICIGWSGSFSTIKYFEYSVLALKIVKEKYGDRVYFKVIGDNKYKNSELDIQGIAWSKQDEIDELNEIDIGLMPLPDDPWTRGKCGLKGLQYMALEIATIMSPVGVNSEIIQDGENGFLASTTEEWVEKISLLIENPELRRKLGQNGRKTVVEKYSKNAWKDKYIEYFHEVLNMNKK